MTGLKKHPFLAIGFVALIIVAGIVIFYGWTIKNDKTDFTGQWNSDEQNISVDISMEDDKTYFISITATKDEESIYFWEMEAVLEEKTLVYSDGILSVVSYDEFGNAQDEIVYEDGNGSFEIRNHKLYWEDLKDGFGDSKALEKTDSN